MHVRKALVMAGASSARAGASGASQQNVAGMHNNTRYSCWLRAKCCSY
jgi:hypothetical protein